MKKKKLRPADLLPNGFSPSPPKHLTPADFHAHAEMSRRTGDSVTPDTAIHRYSIAACEVWALALDRIMAGGFEPWELFLAFRRKKQLTEIYGVEP